MKINPVKGINLVLDARETTLLMSVLGNIRMPHIEEAMRAAGMESASTEAKQFVFDLYLLLRNQA